MLSVLLLCAVLIVPASEHQPRVVVDRDDVRIDRSCIVEIDPAAVIADENGDGVIHIVAPDVTVRFAAGSALWGSARDAEPQTRRGVGVRIDGVDGVELIDARVHGFKVGILATEADGLVVRDTDLSDQYAQKLASTAAAEVTSDWLWPHRNDDRQWVSEHGAAICVERSDGVTIEGVRVRRSQNGIMLDRVNGSRIAGNDCSFLSGWGLSLWRSSGNEVVGNAFDFCVRGYSHGVYNRGQDAAGILAFEQCSDNRFIGNSATHCGNGFFGFAGVEAMGADRTPGDAGVGFDHTRRGCNDNLFEHNDLSHAVIHGAELTFSFGNVFSVNRFAGNAVCGIWGGYTQETGIERNLFRSNGHAGYHLQQGGINIEGGSGTIIRGNVFDRDTTGVHLWLDEDDDYLQSGWGRANYPGGVPHSLLGNQFRDVRTTLRLRHGAEVRAKNNAGMDDATLIVRHDSPLERTLGEPALAADAAQREVERNLYQHRDIRARTAGREHIIVGQWFPYDFDRPTVRIAERTGGSLTLEFFAPGNEPLQLERDEGVTSEMVAFAMTGSGPGRKLYEPQTTVLVNAPPGLHPYRFELVSGDQRWSFEGVFVNTAWDVTVFEWTSHPIEEPAAWRAEAEGGTRVRTIGLDLAFASGGPGSLPELARAGFDRSVRDRFGTIARARLLLTAGAWRVRTLSDDGVRVLADGETVIENWTWHGPTWDEGLLVLERAREVELLVEHFELDGFSVLKFEVLPAAMP